MSLLYTKEVKIFKALGDENRMRIINILKDGEKCACKLLEDIDISQSTLSHHMKILCDADIVTAEKDGKWMHYKIKKECFDRIFEILSDISESASHPHECECKKHRD